MVIPLFCPRRQIGDGGVTVSETPFVSDLKSGSPGSHLGPLRARCPSDSTERLLLALESWEFPKSIPPVYSTAATSSLLGASAFLCLLRLSSSDHLPFCFCLEVTSLIKTSISSLR